IQIVDRAGVRVHLPEVDRVTGADSGCADVVQRAGSEIIYAHQIAEEALVGCESLCHGTRGTIGQVLNVGTVAEVCRGSASERAGEDGQRELSGQPVVRKRSAAAIRLVDSQIVLRVLEFVQESVFEDIYFVDVVAEPLV